MDRSAKLDGVDASSRSADGTFEGDDRFVFPGQASVHSIKRTIYIVRGAAITLPFVASLADEHPEVNDIALPAPGMADAA